MQATGSTKLTRRAPNPLQRSKMRVARVLLLLAAGSTLAACTFTGSPVGVSSSQSIPTSANVEIRQTDESGHPLPFDTKFPNRWSINNDGTPYEPCTAPSAALLKRFGLDPASVGDVAASDFQTARGCRWRFVDERRSSLAQQVGDLVDPTEGLEGYKRLNTSGSSWYPDFEINGRTVVMSSLFPGECGVTVQSGSAVVVTSALRFGVNRPPQEQICSTASEFLRATIDEIPR